MIINYKKFNMSHTNLAIIGSGPAGYTAAIYTGRAEIEPVLFSGHEAGGQLMYTTEVENFPGFPEGIMGPEFMMGMKRQAEKFGTHIVNELVTAVDFSQRPFKLWTDFPDGYSVEDFKRTDKDKIKALGEELRQTEPNFTAEAVIVSTGAASIRLGIPGEQKYMGKGVSTCAVCDAAFFRDKKVYVIGGGDSAMEDALALSKFTGDVTVIHRRDELRASKIMQKRVLEHEGIDVMWNTELKEVKGGQVVTEIVVEHEGERKTLAADGVFLAIGHRPVTALLQDQVLLDDRGFVVTSQNYTEEGLKLAKKRLNKNGVVDYPSMTSVEGVFAAGDVVDLHYKQAITAAGFGGAAALDAEKWLGEHLD